MSNPEAWTFMMAMLPPFIDVTQPLPPQIAVLLVLMGIIEFVALLS